MDQHAKGRQKLSPPQGRPVAPASPSTAASCAAGAGLARSTATSSWRRWRRCLTIGGRKFAPMILRGPRPSVVGAVSLPATAPQAAWCR